MSNIVQTRIFNNFFRDEYNNKIFGIQAQNIDAAGLSLFLRNPDVNYIEYQNMLDKFEIIRMWGQRNTLHIYDKELYPLIRIFNVSYGNWFEKKWNIIDKAFYLNNIILAQNICNENDSITRTLLVDKGVDGRLVDNWGGIFIDLCQKGCVIPDIVNGKTVFRCISSAANDVFEEDYFEVLNKMCISYFDFFGPARISDFAHWIGMKNDEALKIVMRNSDQLMCNDSGYFFLDETDNLSIDTYDKVIITAKFDNIFLAYADKKWIAEECFHKQIWIKSGLVESTVIYHNRVIGVWRYKKLKIIKILLKLFYTLSESDIEKVVYSLKEVNEKYWLRKCEIKIVDEFDIG